MTMILPELGAGELASRLRSEMGMGTWFCIVASEERLNDITHEIEHALRVGKTTYVHIGLNGSAKPMGVATHESLVIFTGFATFSDDEWHHLDELRSSRFVRHEPALLIMSPESRLKLARLAPNMASFLGGAFFGFEEQSGKLSEEERQKRLADLQNQFDKTNDEFMAMASTGVALDEPEYAEWLVLLNRGDLLKR